ncbi:hypothetical protein J2T60_001022 [Natronospira proteinivora]|uniref:DUF411 domain-containing protein n=1 Tax=Natronospira proteinivora TaxID=1807133 RepID=A0ABT1GAW3_9GAMM|nr:DUF411 domain-containing protein [Natronospira proteinivora]MCP1727057.1 hypothetical protein [Natronospira proteinivora]
MNWKLLIPLIALTVLAALAAMVWSSSGEETDGSTLPEMTVYKTPECGCCSLWADHAEQAGFPVTARDVSHRELNGKKAEAGLPHGLGSCHTTFVDGYVIEGHVPIEQVERLLQERPDALGLAVPGMPVGSPGMEMGDRQDPYEVVKFDAEGGTEVYARYPQ